ncbi:MAG: hypothetical protein M1827_007654 [Pycnora praestabilis]|nr:MAG: hypothetical protein M1827_007654 [Pycnora praestabilis]
MASAVKLPMVPAADLESFSAYLRSSNRILALLGAGLSASSGLPTFRGAGGLWRSHDAMSLATPEAFDDNPGLVWQFYSHRRHMALQAKPNKAHLALAELAIRKGGFLTLSQNVDGLSQRAGHPQSKLHLLHGSLFDVKCTSFYCNYTEQNNFTDPIVPALAITSRDRDPTPSDGDLNGTGAIRSHDRAMDQGYSNRQSGEETDSSDEKTVIPELNAHDLPHCPKCGDGLLRPGVVWFGEMLPEKTIVAVDDWIKKPEPIDLMLVIGTSAKVFPAAGYVDRARAKGARIAVVNMDRAHAPGGEQGLMDEDWFFEGDAGIVIPEILKSVIGDIDE